MNAPGKSNRGGEEAWVSSRWGAVMSKVCEMVAVPFNQDQELLARESLKSSFAWIFQTYAWVFSILPSLRHLGRFK